MATAVRPGDCVRIPDGRVARVRDVSHGRCRVRVRRKTSRANQFLTSAVDDLERVECPKGWMSPEGYNRYLAETLARMRERNAVRPMTGDDSPRGPEP